MRRRKGFTLIELLVVISIIAVLVGILLPALNAARRSAVAIQCASNQKNIGIGAVAYLSDVSKTPEWWLKAPSGNPFRLYDNTPRDKTARTGWWVGLGFVQGYVEPTIFYDPEYELRTYLDFESKWRDEVPAISGGYTANCFYNANISPTSQVDSSTSYGKRIINERTMNTMALASCAYAWPNKSWGLLSEREAQHLDAYNVLYGDGSVIRISHGEALDLYAEYDGSAIDLRFYDRG